MVVINIKFFKYLKNFIFPHFLKIFIFRCFYELFISYELWAIDYV